MVKRNSTMSLSKRLVMRTIPSERTLDVSGIELPPDTHWQFFRNERGIFVRQTFRHQTGATYRLSEFADHTVNNRRHITFEVYVNYVKVALDNHGNSVSYSRDRNYYATPLNNMLCIEYGDHYFRLGSQTEIAFSIN